MLLIGMVGHDFVSSQMNMSIKRFPERLKCMIFQKQFDERMAEIELVCSQETTHFLISQCK